MDRYPAFTKCGENKWCLTGKRGKIIDNEVWDVLPEIEFGFIISQDHQRLYTLLGDRVELDADYIDTVFKYWCVYNRDGVQYITYLEPFGMIFETTCELRADKIGLLSYEGCVISNSYNNWDIYKYDFGDIYPDNTPPMNDINIDRISDLIRKGFTLEYLEYISKRKLPTPVKTTKELWKETTVKFLELLEKVYELSLEYTLDDISDIMCLRTNIIASIKQIGKFIYINKDISDDV